MYCRGNPRGFFLGKRNCGLCCRRGSAQSLPCLKGGGRAIARSEGFCGKSVRIRIGLRRIRNAFCNPPVKNQRFLTIACGRSGRGSASPPDWHSLPRLRFAYPLGKGGLRHASTPNNTLPQYRSSAIRMRATTTWVRNELAAGLARETIIYSKFHQFRLWASPMASTCLASWRHTAAKATLSRVAR